MKWKRLAAMCLLLAVSFLSGCSLSILDPGSLMQPPRPTADKEMIRELLRETAGEDLKLRYPRNGTYRSAIISSENMTGNHDYDVIGFYETADESGGTTLIFLSKMEGEWAVVGSFEYVYSQIDRVVFGDLDGDGKQELIVGWGSPANQTGVAYAYTWSGDQIQEIKPEQATYSELTVTNLKEKEKEELLIVNVSRSEVVDEKAEIIEERPASATLYEMENNRLRPVSSVQMDSSVVRYAQAQMDLVDQNLAAVVFDGVKADNSMVTEVLFWNQEKGRLQVAPSSSEQGVNFSQRSAAVSITSRDINRDKLIEIPTVELFPGYEDTPEAIASYTMTHYIVKWNRFDAQTKELLYISSTVINTDDGYWFQIPDQWEEKVTCELNATTRTLTFFEWRESSADSFSRGNVLLKIRVFSVQDWNEFPDAADYILLERQNNLIYTAKMPEGNSPLLLSVTEMEEKFNLFS